MLDESLDHVDLAAIFPDLLIVCSDLYVRLVFPSSHALENREGLWIIIMGFWIIMVISRCPNRVNCDGDYERVSSRLTLDCISRRAEGGYGRVLRDPL